MNFTSGSGRNNILMRPGNSNFLSSSTSNFQKNKERTNYSQEFRLKEKSNNKNENKKSVKYSNNNNQIIDYKKNITNKKPKVLDNKFNYLKSNSLFEKNNKFNFMSSKVFVLETEPTKINDNFYKKLNTKNYINNEIFSGNNKPSSHILSTYYSNKNQLNKMSIKKKNNNINFNDNSPSNRNSKNAYSKNARNMNLILNNINSSNNNINTKYQSFININKIINKDFHDFPDLSIRKNNFSKKNYEISNKTRQNNVNYTKINSLYLNRPLSSYNSNIYSKTENNINFRNNSNNNSKNKFNTNYNLINISSPKNRSNTYSNINSFHKKPKSNNYLNEINPQNNNNIQNQKKNQRKSKNNYSFSQNDNKIDKICLNKFYEETFSNSNENKIKDKKFEDKNKTNNEEYYKDNLTTTNQSTYTNCSKKIKNLKQTNKSLNQNLIYKNQDFENFEELHFSVVSSLQNGKKLSKMFN